MDKVLHGAFAHLSMCQKRSLMISLGMVQARTLLNRCSSLQMCCRQSNVCRQARASKSELVHTILGVADVTAVCTAAIQHIQSLLLLPKSVEVLSNYQIGQYLKYLSPGSSHDALNALIAHLCSQASSTEVQQYRSLLNDCGCSQCLRDDSWLDTASQRERPGPAKVQRQEPSVFMTLTKATNQRTCANML